MGGDGYAPPLANAQSLGAVPLVRARPPQVAQLSQADIRHKLPNPLALEQLGQSPNQGPSPDEGCRVTARHSHRLPSSGKADTEVNTRAKAVTCFPDFCKWVFRAYRTSLSTCSALADGYNDQNKLRGETEWKSE